MKKPSRQTIIISAFALASLVPLSANGYGSPMPGTPFLGFPENFPDPNHLICKHAKKSHSHLPNVDHYEVPFSDQMKVSTPAGSDPQAPHMTNGNTSGQTGGQTGGPTPADQQAPQNRDGAQGYLFQPSPGPMMTPIVGIRRPTPAQRISSLGTTLSATFAAFTGSVH
jgi:hypothetical protein